MSETLDDLRAALRARADAATVPPPPFEGIGDQLAARRRRRRALVAAVAAAAVVVGVVTAVGVDRTGSGERRDPAGTPSGTPTPTPAEDAEVTRILEQGAVPEVAYAAGDKLVLGRETVTLNGQPDGLVQGGRTVMVLDGDGLRLHTFGATGVQTSDPIASPGMGAVDPRGRYAAWQKAGEGPAVVVVRRLDGSEPDREMTYPATPTCCDNPFQVRGITTDGRVLSALPGEGKAWVWDFAHDRAVQEISGLGSPQGTLQQVVGSRVVVMDLNGDGARIGDIDADGRWRPDPDVAAASIRPVFDEFSAWSPDGRRIVSLSDRDDDGSAVGVDAFDENSSRSSGGFVQYSMNLPTGRVESTPVWEDKTHVVFLFQPAGTSPELVVRCDATTYGCERTAGFTNTNVLLPQ